MQTQNTPLARWPLAHLLLHSVAVIRRLTAFTLAAAFFANTVYAATISATSTTVLPLEVLGPKGTSATATLNLSDVTGITSLYIQCHACGYGDKELETNPTLTKASVRINGGAAIALKHYTGDGRVHGNAAITVIKKKGPGSIKTKCTNSANPALRG